MEIRFDPLPIRHWLKDYNASKLRDDLIAGLTVAAVLVPQSMAYALLARMPAIHGLYASFLAVAVAAIFGSSRFLATGPVAMTALLSASVLYGIAEPGSEKWIHLMALLAFLVGIIRLSIGLFRLGSIVDLISPAVITGFVSAGAIVIALSQLEHLLGFRTAKSTIVVEVLLDILKKIHLTNPYTLLVGFISFLIIYVSRRIHPLIPGALIAVFSTSFLAYFYNLHEKGVALVGDVPQGIPSFYLPVNGLEEISTVFVGALVVAFFGLMEAVAIAKRLANQVGDKWDVNQELIGQGLANIVSAFFKGFPIGGSFSRSALNFQLGAKTPMASVFTSIAVGLTLLFIAPYFKYLPKATLAVIVMMAVINLIRPWEIYRLYKVNKEDGIVAAVTFVGVLVLELWIALLLGIILALGIFVYKTMYPRIVILTRNPASNTFVNAQRENLPECPQILYVRPNMSIYFGNAEYVGEYIVNLVKKRKESTPLKYVLVDMEAVNYMDASGAQNFMKMVDEIQKLGVKVSLANIGCDIYPLMERLNIDKLVDANLIFDSKGQSIGELFSRLDHEYCAKECPYVVFRECLTVKQPVKL
ncbi:SulP family inorganic anion transporter [Thermocrinis minervae]|uniref:Sulfate permease, SulP family n=1 Tax=Thermocrinis minervae TaxID=381751 RepID=A0A1M6SV60_9AQUI|nr:SulP family inorganic anion transporter [Thermocrinis minervae]SHK48622.1 sulfate permease, SulP family [Thermocrinis minervae]